MKPLLSKVIKPSNSPNYSGFHLEKKTKYHFPTLGPACYSTDVNYGGKSETTITFTQKEGEPRVILGNKWDDCETGSCSPVPQYRILSPLIDPRLNMDNGWTILLRQLNVSIPLIKEHATIVTHKQIGLKTSPLLDVLVFIVYDYSLEQWVYRAQIGLDNRAPEKRQKALKRYEKYLQQYEEFKKQRHGNKR